MLLNDVWGDWLQQGHTRFPENFSLDATVSQQLMFYDRPFGLSLCHGANGVPPIIVALYGIIGFSQDSEGESVYTHSSSAFTFTNCERHPVLPVKAECAR